MAKFNLSSVYSSENTFTILKLLRELCKTIDSVDFEEEIKDSKGNPIPMEWFSELFDKLQISDSGTVEIGKDLEVDGDSKLGQWHIRNLDTLPDESVDNFGLFYDSKNDIYLIGVVSTHGRYSNGWLNYHCEGLAWNPSEKSLWALGNAMTSDDGTMPFAQMKTSGSATELVDLITKVLNQPKTYTHCVEIKYAPVTGSETKIGGLVFMADSSRNTPCDSWQDIFSLFGGRKIMCNGINYILRNNRPDILYIDLHGGSIDTLKLGIGGGAFPPITDNVSFSDILGEGTLTITDDVIVAP